MTTTDRETTPDVAAFVADVRSRLADLTTDEREELLDGLEADLADQVADGATHLLEDPTSYAAELRAAAGLPAPRTRRIGMPRPRVARVGAVLDGARARWFALTQRHPLTRQVWALAVTLRPAWWVLRAWVAVTLVDQVTGEPEDVTLLPHFDVAGVGVAVLVGAVVLSALIGQGRLWPGSGPGRRTVSRLVLLGLNVVAVLLPLTFATNGYGALNGFNYSDAQTNYVSSDRPGVVVNGRSVHNIFAYDAQGQPLTGVQLFDPAGRPIALTAAQAAGANGYPERSRVVGCPWVNGTQRLFNVFPLPERQQRGGKCRPSLDAKLGTGALPDPPLAQVPPVSLPTPPSAVPATPR